jgi:hypothetical protein
VIRADAKTEPNALAVALPVDGSKIGGETGGDF